MLPNMTAYVRDSVKDKHMSFLIKVNKLLEKYNQIWDKVTNTIKKKDLTVSLYAMKNI